MKLKLFEKLFSEFTESKYFSYSLIKIIIIFIVLIILNQLVKFLLHYYTDTKKKRKAFYNLINRDVLIQGLTDKSFLKWCGKLLTSLQFKNITFLNDFYPGSVNIIAYYENEKVYISSKLYGYENDFMLHENSTFEDYNLPKKYKHITKNDIQIFLGSMIHDNVKKGIIMTTGDISQESLDFLEVLPKEYNIELIDGQSLVSTYLSYRFKNSRKQNIVKEKNNSIELKK